MVSAQHCLDEMTTKPHEIRGISREIAPPGFLGAGGREIVQRFEPTLGWLAEKVPAPIANAVNASFWLSIVDAFRKAEETLMLNGTFDAFIDDHRVYISTLIADGEMLMEAINKTGMEAINLTGNFTPDDLKATLDSLHNTFQRDHGPKNSAKTNEAILSLFDVSER